jgi:hypothetical protein
LTNLKQSAEIKPKRRLYSRLNEQDMPPSWEGWGILLRSGSVAHWFQMDVRGRLVSLCRMVRDNPKHIDPAEHDRKCQRCLEIIARSGVFNPVLARRSVELDEPHLIKVLQIRLSGQIARFMADPNRGPRLYICPTCRQAMEGRTDQPHFCEGNPPEKPHAPAKVLELARKDGPPDPGKTR